MSKVICPYCGSEAEYIDSKNYYSNGRSYGMIYICRPCNATVGVHKGTSEPLGTLATKELKGLRIECHKALDAIQETKKMSWGAVYKWLARVMDMTQRQAHVGKFREDDCRKFLKIVGEIR